MTTGGRAPAPLGGYSQTQWAGNLCFVSGQVPVDREGNHAIDVAGQAAQVFQNLDDCLADEGLTLADVVSLVTYLRDATTGAEVAAVRSRFLDGHRPTSTVVEVSGLLDPAWHLEVQAIATTPQPANQ